MNAELAAVLVETTVASGAALLLVLALRRPIRAVLGASAFNQASACRSAFDTPRGHMPSTSRRWPSPGAGSS